MIATRYHGFLPATRDVNTFPDSEQFVSRLNEKAPNRKSSLQPNCVIQFLSSFPVPILDLIRLLRVWFPNWRIRVLRRIGRLLDRGRGRISG